MYSKFEYDVKVVHADAPDFASTLALVASTRRPRHPQPPKVGDRIRQLRKAKGLTQTQLGRLVGVTQRVVTYYENEGGTLAPDLLARFAKALDVSADHLLGRTASTAPLDSALPENLRLWRKLKQVEALPLPERRQVVQFIDALVERNTLKRQKAS